MKALVSTSSVGIGLRAPHVAALLAAPAPLGFVEVHSENYFADGGAALAQLRAVRALYPVSLHGVGLGLGSAAGLDVWHLDRLERLVRRIEPVRVSDHACFARTAGHTTNAHANDLLPIAFTEASLALMVANVTRVQERLRRPLLVENLAAYVSFNDDVMGEPEFLAALCRRSGCGLLLDVNNLMVNALNQSGATEKSTPEAALAACFAYVDALPIDIVGELHVAGYAEVDRADDADGALVIDDHGSRVRDPVWAVCAHALRRFGTLPVLVEWDTDLPEWSVLLDEADRAAHVVIDANAAAALPTTHD